MRVLVACEFSGIVCEAFRKRGHDAWSCDLLPTEIPGPHIQDDVLLHLEEGWDMMIAHPPCTYLSNAGVRHLHEHVASRNGVKAKVNGTARMEAMSDGAQFFLSLLNANIPRKAIENPVPHRYARRIMGRYNQKIQPWQFGDEQTKPVCLWLVNLPPLIDTVIATKREPKCHLEPPGSDRWKNRSRFFPGIANAMAGQWGSL